MKQKTKDKKLTLLQTLLKIEKYYNKGLDLNTKTEYHLCNVAKKLMSEAQIPKTFYNWIQRVGMKLKKNRKVYFLSLDYMHYTHDSWDTVELSKTLFNSYEPVKTRKYILNKKIKELKHEAKNKQRQKDPHTYC